ncbi:MAG TPA: hypothetical protein VGS19_28490, partial [Streptosporangiaceae bacterium]|nr:hypothetical protein [Streptosporangiaceae bacterium]
GCNALQPDGRARRRVINGWHVDVETSPVGSQVCTANADGLSVYLSTGPRATPSAVGVFAHHLRLLGPDPAHWTTRPTG